MKIKCLLTFLFVTFFHLLINAQSDWIQGKVSFISSQNVYINFNSTQGINVGDTLYTNLNDKKVPALVVKYKSSMSCVGAIFPGITVNMNTSFTAKIRKQKNITIPTEEKNDRSVNETAIKKAFETKKNDNKPTSTIDGRLSVNSYTNISQYYSDQRFRYTLSLNAIHIANSKLDFDSYLSFSHLMSFPARTSDWQGLANALKIYSLSLKYNFSPTFSVSMGRKINVNMANIGSVDGLQIEKIGKTFSYGALAGFRPNDQTYAFDPALMQYGGYFSHQLKNENGSMLTTIAFFNQMNNFKTDRRFIYFQQVNSLLKNVNLFTSFEFDLYKVVNYVPLNTFDLTGTYVSLQYRPWENTSFSLAYDARKNVYYYETYPQNKLDSILDKETRQGFRFNFNYRPFRNLSWGGNVNYRIPTYTSGDSIPTMNANTYLTYTRLPFDTYGMVNFMALRSTYNDGLVYGAMLSKDFMGGIINAQGEFRMTNYYRKKVNTSNENTASLSLFWRIAKKSTVSVNLEGTFTKDLINNVPINYGRLYINFSQRF